MFEKNYVIDPPETLLEDIQMVFSTGGIIDRIVYISLGLLILAVVIVLLAIMYYLLSKLKSILSKVLLKEKRVEFKAQKYKESKEKFLSQQKELEALERQKQELKKEKRQEELERKKKIIENEELVAISKLNYKFFTPENGYPSGPSFSQRLALEEERLKRNEYRTMTDTEVARVKKGYAYDGSIFGGEAFGEYFESLKKSNSGSVVKGFPSTKTTKGKSPSKNKGNVVSFPKK